MSSRDRRAVMLGAIVLLPPLLYIWGVRPYRNALADAREQLRAERETLARERAAVALAHRNPQLQRVADSAMRDMTPRLFAGRDDVMASAELASYVGEVGQMTRVWLQDVSTRPPGPLVGGVRTLRVELRGESDLAGILRFLQNLERGSKLVRIDRLDISHSPRSDDEEMETLSITATVSGFAIAEPAAGMSPVHPAASSPRIGSPRDGPSRIATGVTAQPPISGGGGPR
jgi:hypothetical protein